MNKRSQECGLFLLDIVPCGIGLCVAIGGCESNGALGKTLNIYGTH